MLYERWRQVAQQHGNETALRDFGSQRQWTFSRLSRAAETWPSRRAPLVCPQGHSAEFILDVLAAWRAGEVVCPLEPYERPPGVPLPPKDCCHLKTTSATTGTARVVAFRGEQLAADAQNIVDTMGLRPEWPNLAAISLAHSYGFSNLVLPLLLHGIPLVLVPAPLPEVIRRIGQEMPKLTLPAVPALWHAWHEAEAIPPGVQLAISAGAPLLGELERAVFARSRLKIHNFYGSTECGGIAYDRTIIPREDDSCVGQALANVQLALSAEGSLRVQSLAVGETYWPEPSDRLGGGWFQTSDLASIAEGQVHLHGRVSDQINVAGRKISPTAIEQALRAHQAVGDCLVFGVPSPDADRTDQIVACVVAKTRTAPDELRQFLLEVLPGWQVPRLWWFVDSLAANHRGKLSRAEWRERFLKRRC
jgi:acyl-CoA synthetase (AMP-forming)/AMP-acid ligase II